MKRVPKKNSQNIVLLFANSEHIYCISLYYSLEKQLQLSVCVFCSSYKMIHFLATSWFVFCSMHLMKSSETCKVINHTICGFATSLLQFTTGEHSFNIYMQQQLYNIKWKKGLEGHDRSCGLQTRHQGSCYVLAVGSRLDTKDPMS